MIPQTESMRLGLQVTRSTIVVLKNERSACGQQTSHWMGPTRPVDGRRKFIIICSIVDFAFLRVQGADPES